VSATLLERMAASRANYWAGFVLDVVVSVAMIAGGAAARGAWLPAAAAVALGWLVFSFYEYALHRWVYHGPRSPFSTMHAWHHRDNDVMLGAPFFFTLGVTAIDWALAALVVGRAVAAVFAGTVLFAYATQSAIHHVAHAWPGTARVRDRGRGLVGRLRRHHMLHHHGGGGVNFGVSTTLWDRVFGTAVSRVGRGRAPRTAPAPRRPPPRGARASGRTGAIATRRRAGRRS
jgi:sterol desaturase/sphingolipid hydroxylase (fatty acid hydroxylase superfamily)